MSDHYWPGMPPDTVGKNLEKKILESSKGDVNISQHWRHDPTYQGTHTKSAIAVVCQSRLLSIALKTKQKNLWKKQN